jgi:hypothetical protein
MKTLGTQRVRAPAVSMMNTGELGFHAGVAAGLPGGAQARRGEARRVGLALDELRGRERLHRLPVLVEREEGVVLLGREAGLGLEPVGEVRHPVRHRPFLDRLRHHRRDLHVELLPWRIDATSFL